MSRSISSVVLSLFVAAEAAAADVSGQRMVWAHYVPWLTPDNASQMCLRYYDFPQFEVGENPFRDEIERALAQGIDGFFNDAIIHKSGGTSFWDLRPFLKAAEGLPFYFGICLDGRATVDMQVKELVKMLSTYGNHPNYPKWKDRYVVCTYSYKSWNPEEWREIREGCEKSGYPIYLIANIEPGINPYDDKRFEPYVGQFERAYFFANSGFGKTLEQENREASAFCARHGARFMPCLYPGYYGNWINRKCSFYQPFLGFDALLRRHACAMTLEADWLHVTTWNDHDETTLQSRRLATGHPAIVKAMADEFKGLPPAAKANVQFAYLRETLPGTVLRVEALRLPSAETAVSIVRGRLLDISGKKAFDLQPRILADGWSRTEWLVPTTALAASPVLIPEVSVALGAVTNVAVLPPVFLVTTCLKNPETVKVSVNERRAVRSRFDLAWKDGVLTGTCDFDGGGAPLKRAVLYRNDRPVTAFVRGRQSILPVFFTGRHTVELKVEGGRVLYAVKSFERNGSPTFSWDAHRIVSRRTPGWMRMTARVEADAKTRLVFACGKAVKTCSAEELVAAKSVRVGDGEICLSPDGTLYDLPPLGAENGRLNISVWMEKPARMDAFWVEFEFADGTFAESRVGYPFADGPAAPVEMNVVETVVTLEHTTGAAGLPDSQPFLTPKEDWPVVESRVVTAKVSPLSIRRERFDFDGKTAGDLRIPARRWPMGAFRLSCTFTPLASDGAAHPILTKNGGWNEGPELNVMADGRIEAVLNGGSYRGTGKFSYPVRSLQPLERGRKVRISLVSDCRTFSLYVDGECQGRCQLPAFRAYGNLAPCVGPGVNGENASVGLLHDLEFTGETRHMDARSEMRTAAKDCKP